jgi:capsular exopolysaccharide synthesis family protein
MEAVDDTVRGAHDVEQHVQLPVVGVLTRSVGLVRLNHAAPEHVQAYRMLRNNLEFSRHVPIRALAVLSAGQGEGKSVTAANLACVYAQHGARVLVVDTDMRRPAVHTLFDLPNERGVADFLAARARPEEMFVQTTTPNVWILPAGRAAEDQMPLFTTQKMADLNRRLDARFDMVIYDTPPILGVSDAAVVTRETVNSILVIQHRRYSREMHRRAAQLITSLGADLIGAVLVGVHPAEAEHCSGYYDRSLDYRAAREQAEQRSGTAPTVPAKSLAA